MRLRHGGTCYRCGERVLPGDGKYEKIQKRLRGIDEPKWQVTHVRCEETDDIVDRLLRSVVG